MAELPKMGTPIRPPGYGYNKSKPVEIPNATNIWGEYRDIKKSVADSRRPSYVKTTMGAAGDAVRSMRELNGNRIKPRDVVTYERMTNDDFENVRQQYGLDTVERLVKDMEYKRLGG